MMKWVDINCFAGPSPFPLTVNFADCTALLRELDDLGIAEAWYSDFGGVPVRSAEGCDRRLRTVPVISGAAFGRGGDWADMGAAVRVVRWQIDRTIMPVDWSFDAILSMCRERHWILLADFRPVRGFSHASVTAEDLRKLVDGMARFPEQPVILSSLKLSPLYREVAELLKVRSGVYLDLSAFQFFRALEYLKRQGVLARVLFGSAMPYFDAGQFMVEVRCSELSDEEKRAIASDNAERVLEW